MVESEGLRSAALAHHHHVARKTSKVAEKNRQATTKMKATAMDEDDDCVNVNGLSQEFERELAVGRAPKRACSQVDVRDAGR